MSGRAVNTIRFKLWANTSDAGRVWFTRYQRVRGKSVATWTKNSPRAFPFKTEERLRRVIAGFPPAHAAAMGFERCTSARA